ncbi:MAG TPA: sterol-binding protein [Micromonosporaceae bacterium]|jgi:hypothetical protein
MATVEQCRQAIEEVAARMAADPGHSGRDLNRSFACHVTGVQGQSRESSPSGTWDCHGRLAEGTILGLTDGDDPDADVRLSLTGDDLLALVAGDLHFGRAWASGRLHVHASFRDLLRLRKLI